MKSMGWTTKETLRSINNEMNNADVIQQQPQYPPPNFKKQPMSCCDRCSCECIKKIETTILRSTSPPKAKENFHHEMNESMSRSPRKAPHYALPQQCTRHLEPIQQAPAQSSRQKSKVSPVKKQSRASMGGGGVELVPLFAKRRDDRPISLSTTDITKYKINKSR